MSRADVHGLVVDLLPCLRGQHYPVAASGGAATTVIVIDALRPLSPIRTTSWAPGAVSEGTAIVPESGHHPDVGRTSLRDHDGRRGGG